jgi:succinate dehydrogenase / fumarate reductase flavoprotein subunit
MVDNGQGVGPLKNGVYLDFADAIERLGKRAIVERYGNLFEMYERIAGEDPYTTPMRIYPASHYTMGGLWVDYNLMTTLDGLFAIGECNFSDHGANRLGASALMQGLADGYFVVPYTVGNYLAEAELGKVDEAVIADTERQVSARVDRLLSANGRRTPDEFHRELGSLMWEHCSMSRNAGGLRKALDRIPELRSEFWEDVKVVGSGQTLNQTLEKAGRVGDFLELAELMCRDALNREESCGSHFREEHVTKEGEALRDDTDFAYVAAWEHRGDDKAPILHKEELDFEFVLPTMRSYK